MPEALEVWRGGAAAWEYDAEGRLSLARQAARIVEGLIALAAELGLPHAYAPHADATLILNELHLRQLGPAPRGAILSLTGGVQRIEEESVRLGFLLRADGALAAAAELRLTHATAREGRAFPWAERVHRRCAELTLDVWAEAGAPQLPKVSPGHDAELERIGLGAVRSGHCDPFGRLRLDALVGMLEDALRAGGAGPRVVEQRLAFHEWPQLGDRIDLRSAADGAGLAHRIINPATGYAWATGASALAG